jgi:hypothetical protein
MNHRNWLVLALLGSLWAGAEANAGGRGFIYVGGGPRTHVHVHHGPYARPVYVRRIYPSPYIYEVPVYVEQPVVVERPVIVQPTPAKTVVQPSTVRQAGSVQPIMPDSTAPSSSSESLKLVPIGSPDGPPPPAPEVVVESVVEKANVPSIEFDGTLPPGPTTDFTVVHPKTGIQYIFPVPACEPEEIDPGRWETEIEYEDGEIEVEFKRDGRVKVKYEFDDD